MTLRAPAFMRWPRCFHAPRAFGRRPAGGSPRGATWGPWAAALFLAAAACGAGDGSPSATVRPGGPAARGPTRDLGWLPRGAVATEAFGCAAPWGTVSGASLAAPRFKPPSTRHALAPWAFWAIDAVAPRLAVDLGGGGGFMLFALAEAATELDLATRLVGAAPHREDAGGDIDACVARHYAPRTELWRMDVDEAAARVDAESVDLLHIDLEGTDADGGQIFARWLPKLSRRGVVLLHDIDRANSDGRARKLWAELAGHYPHFAFHHGAGLGIVGVGSDPPAQIDALFHMQPDDAACVHRIYCELGRRVEAAEIPATCR